MAYEICKRCSKMFHKNGKSYCGDCLDKTKKEQEVVIEYVRKNPDATILDIITETGVTLKSINCLVEEGAVSYIDNKVKEIDEERLSKAMDKILDKKGKFHLKNV